MDLLQHAVSTPDHDRPVAGPGSSAKSLGTDLSGADAARSILGVVQTRLAFEMPAGACDCHVHVFNLAGRFPLTEHRHYTPGSAQVDDLLALQRLLGTQRAVVVQPSPYGTDNSCTLKAVARLGRNGRAVVVVDEEVPTDELRRLHAAGARALRVNLHTDGITDVSLARQRLEAAARLAVPLGWHVECFTNLAIVNALQTVIRALPVPVVFDHFAGADAAAGPGNLSLRPLLSLVADEKAFVKLSAPHRISTRPDCADVAAVARAIIAANPRQVLWGSDWPHPQKPSAPRLAASVIDPFRPVDDGVALNRLAEWSGDAATLRQILVTNPARLYGFDPAA